MARNVDHTLYARARPLVEPPGRRFSYSNEAAQLLSYVVWRAAGETLDRYVERRLFRPLGITDWRWDHDGSGNVEAFTGLALSALDLARLGAVLAASGVDGGRRLLPAAYLAEASRPGLKATPQMGLLFWLRPGGYNANGWQGQYLAVYPRANLVAVRLRQPLTFTEEENRALGFRDFLDLVERTLPGEQR